MKYCCLWCLPFCPLSDINEPSLRKPILDAASSILEMYGRGVNNFSVIKNTEIHYKL